MAQITHFLQPLKYFMAGLLLVTAVSLAACPTDSLLASVPELEKQQRPFGDCSAEDLLYAAGFAVNWVHNDSLVSEGYILMNLIADEINLRRDQKTLEMESPAIQALLAKMGAYKFFFNVNRPSDIEKTLYYLEKGRYSYVFQRFFDRNFHLYTLAVLVVLAIAFSVRRRLKKNKL